MAPGAGEAPALIVSLEKQGHAPRMAGPCSLLKSRRKDPPALYPAPARSKLTSGMTFQCPDRACANALSLRHLMLAARIRV